jgi:ATP-dependent RNA helicase DDX24/MAK5
LKNSEQPMDLPKKRKLAANASKQKSNKKAKRREVLPSTLSWKEVKRPKEAGLDDFEGMLMLEEVDDVEIIYEETTNGRIAKFMVRLFVADDFSAC